MGQPAQSSIRLSSTPSDALDRYRRMLRIRRFEEAVPLPAAPALEGLARPKVDRIVTTVNRTS